MERRRCRSCKNNEIALLVTDLRMPKMDGITLIAHTHNQYPEVPVIVMTAFGSPQIEKQVKDLGFSITWKSPSALKNSATIF